MKLAVIGCGDITKSMLMISKLTKGIKITGVSDINIDKAKKMAARFKNVPAFSDYKKMLETIKCDAVYIAVPHFLHYLIMKDVIGYKKHILCEKPITTNTKDAYEIIKLADKNNIKVGINYQYRYDNACYKLVMAAKNSELGNINFGRVIIPWKRESKYFEQSKWHSSIKKAGGGTLITQGSHLLDIILWIFDSKVISINAKSKNYKFKQIEVEDFIAIELEFESGAIIQMISTMASSKEQAVSIEIYGDKGIGKYKEYSGLSKVSFSNRKIGKYRHKIFAIHPFQRSLIAFRDWILKDNIYLNEAKEAIKVLKLIEEIYNRTK